MTVLEELKKIIKESGSVLIVCTLGTRIFKDPFVANDVVMRLPEGTVVEFF